MLCALGLQPCRVGIFTPLMPTLRETKRLHKGTWPANEWPGFGQRSLQLQSPSSPPYRASDGGTPACSQPESQSAAPGPLYPSFSSLHPSPTFQILVWNLALVSRGEGSHSVDPSSYSYTRPEIESHLNHIPSNPLGQPMITQSDNVTKATKSTWRNQEESRKN